MAFLDSLMKAVNQIDGSDLRGDSSQRTPEQNLQQPQPVSTPSAHVQDSDEETMYSSKIEKLIKMALADGELTEKEKQVLFKRAEEEGIDLDEFEMVLEAKLYERSQKPAPVQPVQAQSAAPKSEKFGDVKKCPACGAMVQTFTTKCVECGHEFRNVETNHSIERLFEMLNEVEAQSKDASGLLGGIGQFYGKMFLSSVGGDKTTRRKKSIIQNFPIPTAKEDIIEFLTLAAPLANVSFWSGDMMAKEFAPVWKAKCEQILMKAKFSMKDDKAALEEIEACAKRFKIKI